MRLIDADYVMESVSIFKNKQNKNFEFMLGIESAKDIVRYAPTVVAETNITSQWSDGDFDFTCCFCKSTVEMDEYNWYKFCPWCGIKMDLE